MQSKPPQMALKAATHNPAGPDAPPGSVGLDCSRLQHIVAAHVSEKNNTREHARQALAGVLACSEDWIGVCDQDQGLSWRALA